MSDTAQKVHPTPIEELHKLALTELDDQLKTLPQTEDISPSQYPLHRALDMLDFIEDLLSQKCLNLSEYLKRISDCVTIVPKPFLARFFTRGEFIIYFGGLGITYYSPDTSAVFGQTYRSDLQERWNRGDRKEIQKLALLTRRQIIEKLIKNLP